MRLHGLDAARFLAFCGMVVVNFRIAAAVSPGSDLASHLTNALEGRAAALFVVLAGVAIALGRPKPWLLLRRALFLFIIGLINLTIFEADILHFYALYFVVAVPFLAAPARGLLIGAGGIIALGLVGFLALDYSRGWDWETLAYADFWTLRGFARHSLFNGWHPVVPWAAFALIGMWIGQLELRNAALQRRLVIWGIAVAALSLLPKYLVADPDLKALLGTAPLPPGPSYSLGGAGSSAAMIGAILMLTPWLDRLGISPWLTAPGRQGLTLYVAHILVGMGTLEAFDLLDGSLGTTQIFWFSLGFCALCSAYALVWHRWFKRGPLEVLMRRMSEARS